MGRRSRRETLASPIVTEFSTMTMKTAWERDEISFILVAPVVRIDPPRSINE